ncbi:Kelch repeat-containing protein [Archangium gephyra]|uniref:Kelch repeat-containing protein n=1 Tax=Archangium gephyra TaxID=48 RepID=UPI003B75E707
MNRVMRWTGLLCGMLTAAGCGGADPFAAMTEGTLLAARSEALATTASPWTMTSALASSHSHQQAALLDSGLVLTMGGYSGEGYLSGRAQLYNPYSNTWQSTGSLSSPRYYFATVKLDSGKVLVSGGWEFWYMLSGAEVYDPATGTWSYAGSLRQRRNSHRATLLQSGKVLVTGGQVEFRNGPDVRFEDATTAELYDPETNTWSPAGNVGHGTRDSVPVLLYSGEVMLITGNVVDIYDPATNTWRPEAPMPAAYRNGFTATRLYSGDVLVVGGSSSGTATFLYDPYNKQWRSGPPTHRAHSHHTATLLYSGEVLIAGGSDGSTERYDPSTNTWTLLPNIPAGYTRGTSLLLHSGQVLVTGGEESNSAAALFTP